MKRIINMLLNMIWPALILFILLVAEVVVREAEIFTIHRFAGGNETFEKSIFIESETYVFDSLRGLTIFLVALFTAMFVAGFVWNIVYSIKHKEEN